MRCNNLQVNTMPKRRCQITSEIENEPTNRQSKEFYEARDAIESGKYLKASNRTLRKYLAELSIVPPWPNDPSYNDPRMYRDRLRGIVEQEMKKRKENRISLIHKTLYSLSIGIAIYICGRVTQLSQQLI